MDGRRQQCRNDAHERSTHRERVQALKKQGNHALANHGFSDALDLYTRALNLEEHHTQS